MPQKLDTFHQSIFRDLPYAIGNNQQEKDILQELNKLGIITKQQNLEFDTLLIFIYKDSFFAMNTCLSNRTLIDFLKIEFEIAVIRH